MDTGATYRSGHGDEVIFLNIVEIHNGDITMGKCGCFKLCRARLLNTIQYRWFDEKNKEAGRLDPLALSLAYL